MTQFSRYAILLTILFGGHEIVFAQPFPELHFQHLTEKDGLSNNDVISITQDKQGFIWVATNNGLNRFDGYRFKRFFHEEGDNISIAGNSIAALVVDAKNNLWITTHSGLSCFNTATGKCISFKHHSGDIPILEKQELSWVYIDTNNTVFATNTGGVYNVDENFEYSKMDSANIESFQYYDQYITHYNKIVMDRKGELWASAGNRLFLLDVKTKKAKQTFIGPQEMSITNIFFDSDNRCWITTWGDGIFEFVSMQNKFRHLAIGINNNYGGSILEWNLNHKRYIVIGSNSYAFILLDPQTMAYHIYQKDGFNNAINSSRSIYPSFVDRQNILWFGSDNGLCYITPSSTIYNIIPVYPNPEKKYDAVKASKDVYTFLQDESGNWISTWYGGGIYRYDSKWHFKKYMPGFIVRGLSEEHRTAYWMRREGREIYCSIDKGFAAIDTGNYHIRFFYPDDEQFAADLRNILPISKNIWWVRSHTQGIYVFDVSKGKFIKHYKHTEGCANCLPNARPEGLMRTKDSTIYVTTEDGLYEYRKASDDFIAYKRNEKDSLTFPTNNMDGFALDSAGRLWIGTEEGICVFNTITKKVEKIFPENKIMGYVLRVCVDDYQNVWFNSYSGNWCWLRKKDRLIHLIADDGFPKNTGTGLFMKGNDGAVYNGCADALVKYYPEKLMDLMQPRPVASAVSEIIANNQLIPFGTSEKNEKQVILSPVQNSFTVDFAVLNYDKVNSNKYYYRLLPAVNQWRQNDDGHLSFYELPPGNYRLEVKGGNEWTGDFAGIDFLLITVKPHWWQTWLFKLLCAIVAAAIIFLLVKRRIANIRKEAAILQQQASFKQKIAETEMQALRAQMNPHFIFNSLNSIENFMMKNDKRMASDYFSKFASLIRMILDSSRNELVPFAKDIEALKLYVELEQLRFDNKFSYQTIIDPVLLNEDYSVPPLLIQPFVENAIIHGLSQSDKEGLRLLVAAILDDGYLIYTIQDNGIGRKQSALYKQGNHLYKSMGMQITQQRINVFNQQQRASGEVTITDLLDESGEPAGTKVQVKLKAI